MVDIMPFGVCSSLANPQVVAATTAALRVLTPMPWLPMTVTPWSAGGAVPNSCPGAGHRDRPLPENGPASA